MAVINGNNTMQIRSSFSTSWQLLLKAKKQGQIHVFHPIFAHLD
jgi:hypothetical protein